MTSGKKRILNLKSRFILSLILMFIILFVSIFIIISVILFKKLESDVILNNERFFEQTKNDLNYLINKSYSSSSFSKAVIFNYGGGYVLDKKNHSAYQFINYKKNKNNFNLNIKILKNKKIQSLLNNKNGIRLIKTKSKIKICRIFFKGEFYYLFYNKLKNEYKLLFFYPIKYIVLDIMKIVLLIMLCLIPIFIIIIVFFISISNSMIYPLKKLNYAVEKASQGYLDVDLVSESKDEIGYLFRNFKRMLKAHIDILSNVQRTTNDIKGFQNSIDSIIHVFNENIDSQQKSINQTLTKYDELYNSIKKVTENVKEAQGVINQARVHSDDSRVIVTDMEEEMTRISETSEQVNFITELINVISEKTRLIAVNSAIEAGKAGEAGKSFGVVADEIRKLARLSHNAASEIGELIKSNENRINAGVSKLKDVIEVLNTINASIIMVEDIIKEINKEIDTENSNFDIVKNINNDIYNFIEDGGKNITQLKKIRNLINNGINDIRNTANSFILKSDKREVIRDVNYFEKDEKKRIEKERLAKIAEQKKLKKEMKEKKRISKIKVKSGKKIDSVRALALYKPKKTIFGKEKK